MSRQQIVRRNIDGANLEMWGAMDPLLKRIYAGRGVADLALLELGLSGLPPPSALLGMDLAVRRLVEALRRDQRVIVVGDFDADGATSCALMMLGLDAMALSRSTIWCPIGLILVTA